MAEGGRFGIGSDSNVLIGLPDELRQLEYSQRLAGHARNVLAKPDNRTDAALFDTAATGGNAALGVSGGGITAGAAADFVALDAEHCLAGRQEKRRRARRLDLRRRHARRKVWVRGRLVVEAGCHVARDAIAKRFRKAMMELTADW
jgi:formimidoylglutamate deiminase